jgi:ABC-type phosphate transport system substrate-binding protein
MRKLFRMILAAAALAGVAAFQTANAEVVVIVSAKSTATTMTADQISQIFLGKSKEMKPVDSSDGPIRSQFYTKVAGKDEAQVKAIWSKLVFTGKAKPPSQLATSAEVVKAVAADPEALGYVDRGAVDSSVKVVYELK